MTGTRKDDLDFTRFDTLTFDCYGTIVDWERGILRELRRFARHHGLRASDAELLTAFAAHEHAEQERAGVLLYPAVLERVMAAIARALGATAEPEEIRAFGASVGSWPPFPDSRPALERLAGRFRLIVISNVDNASFARTRTALGIRFDAVVTAEDTGFWKPDIRAFEAAFARVARLGVVKERTLHVTQSLYHDVIPARRFGLKTVHVDRPSAVRGARATPPVAGTNATPDVVVPSLEALSDLVARAFGET